MGANLCGQRICACVGIGAGGIYNIGSGTPESWNKLVGAAFAALDKPVNIAYIEMPESLRDRYQYYTCAKIDKLRALGYDAPVTPLADAVADYLQNYLNKDLHLGDE